MAWRGSAALPPGRDRTSVGCKRDGAALPEDRDATRRRRGFATGTAAPPPICSVPTLDLRHPRGPAAAARRRLPTLEPIAMEARGPQETFLATSADRRVGQKAVIRIRLLDMPTARSRQLIEQPLRFFQISGVEALGEPAVNRRQKLVRFGPPSLFAPEPREARRGTQFQ